MTRRRFGTIRQLPSGRYQGSYVGPDGKRYLPPHTFAVKKDAEKWIRAEEALIETGTWFDTVKPLTPLFNEYCNHYINTQTTSRGHLKPTTQHLYRTLLRVHLYPFAHKRLTEITHADVRNWWSDSLSTGKKTATSRAYKLLSATLKRAVEEHLIPHSPCIIKGAHGISTGKTIIVPSREETTRLIGKMNPRYQLFTRFLANSGLRFGEAAALECNDLELVRLGSDPSWQVTINKTLVYVEGRPLTQEPKTAASIRKVKLRPELTAPIGEHIASLPDRPRQILFPNAAGGYIRNDVYTNSFRRAVQRAGIDSRVTPHSLRHFAGSEFGRAGANIAELARFLGDSSKESVLRYLHPTDRTDDLLKKMRFVE